MNHNLKNPNIECPECEGNGFLFLSECCGAADRNNGDSAFSDYGICPECKEHCDFESECDNCNGTGTITP